MNISESIQSNVNHRKWLGGYGLLLMILGPIVVRLIFEFLMMALLLVKNVISINNKLRAPGEQSDDADRFGDNSDLDELRQLIRTANKERELNKPPVAYREMYQYLRGEIEDLL